ncbi:MAG: radical SAM protein [Candidatus Electrothrix sp. AW2]|nr:radical SAM protein [Candidatus Electrothrix gigas]
MLFPSTPLSYAVELTYACNNSCTGCANVWGTRRQQILTPWRELFDRITPPEQPDKYAELIRLTGGEPTLHPEFTKIVNHVDSLGIAHVLFTNGRWSDSASIIDLYQGQKNCLGMLVSLHGSSAAAHNTLVGDKKAFAETCANIRQAAAGGIEVFTNTILSKDSCEQVKDIIRLSEELGAEYAVFNRFLGGDNPHHPTRDQLRNAVLQIEDLHSQGVSCRIGNCVPKCFAPNSTEGSNAGIEHCAISPEGLVRPDNLTSTVFGNIFKQSITEIWLSKQAQEYRQQIAPACLDCTELSRCRGGDRSVALEQARKKDPLMTEPICDVKPKTVHLDPSWKPIARFRIREESFGYLVTRYNWSIPVAFTAKPILDAVNGKKTLADIQEQFGDEGLDLIGRLYQEDCLIFKIK